MRDCEHAQTRLGERGSLIDAGTDSRSSATASTSVAQEPTHFPRCSLPSIDQEQARGGMFEVQMFEMFGPERTIAAFRWIDEALSLLPPGADYSSWYVAQRQQLEARLPESVTQGTFPRWLPDDLKPDLSRFVLLEEVFYQLKHGPVGGTEMWSGDTLLGVLPPLEGGWGRTSDGQIRADDVRRWIRSWKEQMDSALGEMIASIQSLTGEADVEVAPGVRMRINPEYQAAREDAEPYSG